MLAASRGNCALRSRDGRCRAGARARPWLDACLSPDRPRRRSAVEQDDAATRSCSWCSAISPPTGRASIRPPAAATARPATCPASRASASRRSGRPTPASASPPRAARQHKRERTALPSGIATAATWNPDIAFRGGAMIGSEARASGFNVMLAGGVDLLREPRNGRNFEYGGEDPLLAGTMVGAEIAGIQSNHIISTIKHYALNDQETGRKGHDARIDPAAARMSDLLAFQFAIERGESRLGHVLVQPGQRRLCLRERLAAQRRAEARLGLPRLCHVRLGRGAQHRQGGAKRARPGFGLAVRRASPISARR